MIGRRRKLSSRKIAVLTFHTAFNCGAHLQAWALQTVLRELGFDPEFPDCIRVGFAPRFNRSRFRSLTFGQALLHELGALGVEDVKRHRFRMFAKRHLNIKPMGKASVGRRYGAVVVGSDQVWNSAITRRETGYFLTTCFKNPELLRYSYAISIGDRVPPADRVQAVYDAARLFENLSVRENLLPGLVDRYGRGPVVDPDPVFLVDPARFDAVACPQRLVRGRYLLVYSLKYNPWTWAAAREAAGRLGLKLVIVQCYQYGRYGQKEGKGVHIAASPDRFLAYFRDAEAVVTSSFHGTAFALVYRKPFAVLPNHDGKPPHRCTSLLAQLQEEFRVVADAGDNDAVEAALRSPLRDSTVPAIARLRSEALKRLAETLPDVSGAPAVPAPGRHSALTWPFRKAWGGVKCLRENGLGYTVRHAFGKVLGIAGVRSRT